MLKLEKKKKALVVIAHPDDETIWMGGTMLSNQQTDWTIFSVCRQSDKDREPKFRRVCREYGARSIISDLDDEHSIKELTLKSTAKRIIQKMLKNKSFDYLFTHGEAGEYGHDRHIAIHLAVKELVAEKKIKAGKVYFLNYRKERYDRKYPKIIPRKNSDYILKLSKSKLERKKKIVADLYGYPWNGPDVQYCTKEEAFINLSI